MPGPQVRPGPLGLRSWGSPPITRYRPEPQQLAVVCSKFHCLVLDLMATPSIVCGYCPTHAPSGVINPSLVGFLTAFDVHLGEIAITPAVAPVVRTTALPRDGSELDRRTKRPTARRNAVIEDFPEGFNQPTYRGMRVNGVQGATWSSQHGWSGM